MPRHYDESHAWRSSCRLLFFYCYGDHRDLHSFPTRRSSDLCPEDVEVQVRQEGNHHERNRSIGRLERFHLELDRKSTRLNSSHPSISYAVFCLKKKTSTRSSVKAASDPAALPSTTRDASYAS